jgi:hypothetical protein
MRAKTILKTTTAVLALVAAVPAAAQNSSLDNLTASQTFPAWQSTVTYTVPSSGTNAGKPTMFGNYSKVTASVRYDHATQSYVVRDTGSISATSTFAPANISSSTPSYTVYTKNSGATTETLRLLKPGAANPVIALTYASYGNWRRSTPTATGTNVNETWFVYGIRTTGANMPRTGGATYNGVIDGSYVNKTAAYTLSGAASFNANFQTGSIGYTATPTGTPSAGAPIVFGTLSGTGSISYNSASFFINANSNNPTYKMSMSGYFFGPAANELGATFRLNAANGSGNGNGVIVAKQ